MSKANKVTGTNTSKSGGVILNADPNTAIRELVRITEKLFSFAQEEEQALVRGDMLRFAYVQQDKERLAEHYAQASEEFRTRLDDFRRADKNLISRLENIQNDLRLKTQDNNAIIAQVKKRAQKKTQATLFTVQELAQRAPVNDVRTGENQ